MEVCLRPLKFMKFFSKQQSSGRQQNEMNRKSKNTVKTFGIVLESLRELVCVCVCVCVCARVCVCAFV